MDTYQKPCKKYKNDGNFRETLEFFYETSGYDRINNNTPLETLTYTKQPSIMVVETDNLMTYVVAYEKYENTMEILEVLNEFLHS